MKRILFFLLIIFSQIIYAQIIRKYSNEFLNIGAGARGLAMGGAAWCGPARDAEGPLPRSR